MIAPDFFCATRICRRGMPIHHQSAPELFPAAQTTCRLELLQRLAQTGAVFPRLIFTIPAGRAPAGSWRIACHLCYGPSL